MVDVAMDKKEEIAMQDPGQLRKITVIMCSDDARTINRAAREFYGFVEKYDANRRQPVILPMEEACLTTRKSPCGNGTASFTRYKLRVHQREFKLNIYDKDITTVVGYLKNTSVQVQLKIE